MKKLLLIVPIVIVVIIVGVLLLNKDTPQKTIVNEKSYYIAMGDSVAAGVGLPTASDSSACDRSDESYPNLIAKSNNFELLNIACSGASSSAGIVSGQEVNKLMLDPQTSSLTADKKPAIITLTVGANDIRWVNILQKCYTGICGDDVDKNTVSTGLEGLESNLRNIFEKIQTTYPDDTPQVYVSGYYRVFISDISAGCSERAGIDSDEMQWIASVHNDLNETIRKETVLRTFATFVKLDFTGHELCSPDPWIQGLAEKAPFHPNEHGQAEYSQSILKAIN